MTSAGEWVKRHWLLLVLLAALGGAAWWYWQGQQAPQAVLPPAKDDNRILSEGIVFPVRYAQMVMPVDGTVGELLVQEGDAVKTGQPLVRLERQDAQARVGSAGANVAKAAAAVAQARVDLSEARRELRRQQQLAAAGAVPRQQLEQAQTAAERSGAALEQALADWQTQQAALEENQGLLDKTELRAPMDGRVAYLDKKLGERADQGTVLVRIADESAWEVRSDDLTELSIARVREGAAVTLTFDGIPGLELPGRVKFIRPYGEKKRGDITYTVTVAPERWDERLRWNMTAQLAIEASP